MKKNNMFFQVEEHIPDLSDAERERRKQTAASGIRTIIEQAKRQKANELSSVEECRIGE